jgi:hypothetical protein
MIWMQFARIQQSPDRALLRYARADRCRAADPERPSCSNSFAVTLSGPIKKGGSWI